ncbi:MAG: SDR family oxidoreductase [Verrucomicrobia bacterium]|nr:SDR family oxidoreductase [Verrucomicrobiota bacterium]
MAGKVKVWVTGAGGLIGNQLVQLAPRFASDYEVVGLTRRELDLTDFAEVKRLFNQQEPQLVIHCAAMSKSPACQAQPKLAQLTNVEATWHLAGLASEIPFVFFSTDLIFDGRKGNYVETDEPNPLSIYAETKLTAEKAVLKNPKHIVVRTSLNAGKSESGDRAFNEEMINSVRNGKTLQLFVDEYRSPIPAEVTAQAVWELVQQNASGIFHLAGAERLSRFEIGEVLEKYLPELNGKIVAGSLRDYHGAPRPPDTSLNCAKLQELLPFPLPAFSEWLKGNASKLV